jgi:hypothetical protein
MSDRPHPVDESDRPHPVDEGDESHSEPADDADESQARAVRALLRRSLSRDVESAPDLLAGVQRRIRDRSRGKFYADGWSTTQARMNYVLIGLLTLLLVVLAYFVLSPMDVR